MKSQSQTIKWRIDPSYTQLSIPNLNLITCLETTTAYSPQPIHRHKDMIEFHYLHKGFQIYQLGEKSYHLKSGDIYISFPEEKHGSDTIPMGNNIIYYLRLKMRPKKNFLGFNTHEANLLYSEISSLKKHVFRGNATIRNCFEYIFAHIDKDTKLQTLLIRSGIMMLLDNILSCANSEFKTDISQEIHSTISDLNNNPAMQLKEAAKKINLSVSRFQHRFRDEVGIPYLEYSLRIRIEKAISLFKEQSLSLTDIALSLNFYSSQQFSSQFKRMVGISPGEFRQKHLNDKNRSLLIF